WSGDLAYADEDGYLYFAGRTSDWMRVDGENFPAGPVQAILARHPDVVDVAVYAVPDADAGDQVMTAVVLRSEFDPAAFARWVDEQPEMAPKWRPAYVRVSTALPRTATNKVLARVLQQEKFRLDRIGEDRLWIRERGAAAYRPFTADDERALHDRLVGGGRERFWDL